MAIPYYYQLEDKNRFIEVKLDKGRSIKGRILASYITPKGDLAEVTSTHKENNFTYCMNRGKYSLEESDFKALTPVPIKYDKKEFVQSDKNLYLPKELFEKLKKHPLEIRCNELKERLRKLKQSNCVNSFDIVDYYNYCGALRLKHSFLKNQIEPYKDYSEEVRQNLIGLISGQISIYETFILLKGIQNASEYESLMKLDKNDFLISIVGFDKVETMKRRAITTSKSNINEVFFNYLIMDWDICQIPGYVIDKSASSVRKLEQSNGDSFLERELKEEISLIKKKVPYYERNKYFI